MDYSVGGWQLAGGFARMFDVKIGSLSGEQLLRSHSYVALTKQF